MCITVSVIPVGIIGGTQGFGDASFLFIGLIFLVTFFVSLSISFFITRPLEKLTNNLNEISKGKLDVNLASSEIYEINNLTNSLNRIMASLKLAIHKVGVKKGELFEDAIKTKEAVEKKQDDLYNSIKGWAWETDVKGIYTFCSGNVSNMLGYKPEEIIGNSFFDYMTPEDGKNAKQIFSETGKKKEPIRNLENWNYNKQGEKVCMVTNGVPFFDDSGMLLGFRGVDIDITGEKVYQQKITELNKELSEIKKEVNKIIDNHEESKKLRLEKEKREQKTIFEKWTEQDFDSVYIFDEKANIIDCNNNICEKLGYSKNELLSLNISDLDILESKEEIINKIIIAKKNGSIIFKTIHKKKDGSAILVHANLQYIKDKKEFKAIVREDISIKSSK